MKAKEFGFELTNWLATHDVLFARMMTGVKMTKVNEYTVFLNFFGANWFIKQADRDARLDPKIYTRDEKIIVEVYGRYSDITIIMDNLETFYLIDSYMLLSFIQNKEAMDLFHNRLEEIYGD